MVVVVTPIILSLASVCPIATFTLAPVRSICPIEVDSVLIALVTNSVLRILIS